MLAGKRELSRKATYEDLCKVPDRFVSELLDGELYVSPRPAIPHANAEIVIGHDVFGRFGRPPGGDSPDGWWILFEPELHFGQNVLVPDVAGWRRERMPVLLPTAHIEMPPDWVCEILSPHTAAMDRLKKMRIYARAEVSFAWLVDPLARTVEVFRRHGEFWTRIAAHGDDEHAALEPFASATFDLETWWLPQQL